MLKRESERECERGRGEREWQTIFKVILIRKLI
jgi:hypothetical protein